MIVRKSGLRFALIFTSALFAVGTLPTEVRAQSAAEKPQAPAASAPISAPKSQPHSSSPYRTTTLTTHAQTRYAALWGIDSLEVKSVESGQLIRFGYRILDPVLAAQLNDKKSTPHLIDEQARVSLEVPTMENAGQLRQSSTPEAGRSYWMVFSNKRKEVKPGDRVTVVVGRFRADGLFVH